MGVTASISLSVKAAASSTAVSELGTVTHNPQISFNLDFTDGEGSNKVQQVWSDERDVATSSDDDLDLAGTLTNYLGEAVTFTKIKVMAFLNVTSSSAAALMQIGGEGINDFINWVANATDIIQVATGGAFVLVRPDATGYAVTAGTGDILRVTNASGANTLTYQILLLGEGTAA